MWVVLEGGSSDSVSGHLVGRLPPAVGWARVPVSPSGGSQGPVLFSCWTLLSCFRQWSPAVFSRTSPRTRELLAWQAVSVRGTSCPLTLQPLFLWQGGLWAELHLAQRSFESLVFFSCVHFIFDGIHFLSCSTRFANVNLTCGGDVVVVDWALDLSGAGDLDLPLPHQLCGLGRDIWPLWATVSSFVNWGRWLLSMMAAKYPSVSQSVRCSVVSDSSWPYGLWPTRLLWPWNSQARILEWVAMPLRFHHCVLCFLRC